MDRIEARAASDRGATDAVPDIHKIRQKLSFYLREIQFVLRNSLDWQTRFNLLKGTVLFHASNMVGGTRISGWAFPARLRLATGGNVEIVIRPFAGDIFILFEVLMGRCYYIPDAILRPEDVRLILDCGANIGITALYFASRYPNARIFSIEPNDENFELLKRNTAAESRIVPIRGAVVGRPRKSVRLTSGEPAWGNFISEEGNGPEIPAFTIEQILSTYNLSHVDLLKVDVEGAEKYIFDDGQFMRQVSFAIVELHGDYDFGSFSGDVGRWNFQAIAPHSGSELKMIIARALGTTSPMLYQRAESDGSDECAPAANRTRL
jgi:FkbM family methyltransferase